MELWSAGLPEPTLMSAREYWSEKRFGIEKTAKSKGFTNCGPSPFGLRNGDHHIAAFGMRTFSFRIAECGLRNEEAEKHEDCKHG